MSSIRNKTQAFTHGFIPIRTVKPLSIFVLEILFENGEIRKYDMKTLIEKYPAMKPLKESLELFNQVHVDLKGFGLIWNENIDLSAWGLYEKQLQFDSLFDMKKPNIYFIKSFENPYKSRGFEHFQAASPPNI